MRRILLASVAMLVPLAVRADIETGSAGGMPYLMLSAGTCSTAKPCAVVEYLHWLGASQQDVANDLNHYFNTNWLASHPNTIVVAPLLADSSPTNNWGGVQDGVSQGLQGAVAVVKQIQSQFATDPGKVIVTGGSMGGLGTQSALVQFGPKGLTGQHVYSGGVSYDGADYVDSQAVIKQTLCGVPLIVQHGSADPSVPVAPDRTMAQTLKGCSGFEYTEIAGAGHGTWGAAYSNGTQLSKVITQVTGAPTAALPSDASKAGAAIAATLGGLVNQAVKAADTVASSACKSTNGNNILPAGYLSTRGNQIVDQAGIPVRLAGVGWNQIWGDIPANVRNIRAYGFNTIRVSWVNATMDEDLKTIDQVVAAAKANGIKVILDNHTNERGTAADGMGSQQANGLWYDVGGASDGTNGAGVRGTVTQEKSLSDWVKVAQHYAGNDTVIGFDLWNEPTNYGKGSNWGLGDPNHDIRMMYSATGSAIQKVNPGVLIIAEGPQDYSQGVPWGDLRNAGKQPVILTIPNKVVYSIHDYPKYVSGVSVASGPQKIQMMNAGWGYLVRDNIAPVWIGEMGANFDGSYADEKVDDSLQWLRTLLDYVSGKAADQGGPTFSQGQAGVSFNWWAWGNLQGQQLNGTMNPDGSQKMIQKDAVDQLIVATCGAAMQTLRGVAAPATDTVIQNAVAAVGTQSTPPTRSSTSAPPAPAAASGGFQMPTLTWSMPAATSSQTAVTAPAVTTRQPVSTPVTQGDTLPVAERHKRHHHRHHHREWERRNNDDDD